MTEELAISLGGTRLFQAQDPPSITSLEALCSRTTKPEEYPLASTIQDNIPIYKLPPFTTTTPSYRAALQDEWYRILLHGPGVLVIKSLFTDVKLINRVTTVFNTIISREASSHRGDHFSNTSPNARIWNALGKHALSDPPSFISYYSNPYLSLVAESWLGPCYRLTAQVNNVRPGSEAQVCHRDYHLGFMTDTQCAQYPRATHLASQFLTLQGAVAHVDMPAASGPTRLLPYSQILAAGYLAYRLRPFIDFFDDHHVALPLNQGDGLFFNPALMHAAGQNNSPTDRLANLLQISSPLGKPMEAVDAIPLVDTCWELLLKHYGEGKHHEVRAVVAAMAEGYPFPTNLDRNAPRGGSSMAPESEREVLWACLGEGSEKELVLERLRDLRRASRA
ncbi:hypothetical protein GQ602_003017 [Ophiocordyceps camponoti-floridani]|uniref:Phytanoyl-CoA dioxygenase n=1 Tax=Ophiocordyceps camponoti-floridani TaxID=2030778 RepID=A0A8H4Q7J6_9HYPO|nr:hypothetical protein GQ602_003017 [Ophiocordyceps camponoti-floridani]